MDTLTDAVYFGGLPWIPLTDAVIWRVAVDTFN